MSTLIFFQMLAHLRSIVLTKVLSSINPAYRDKQPARIYLRLNSDSSTWRYAKPLYIMYLFTFKNGKWRNTTNHIILILQVLCAQKVF